MIRRTDVPRRGLVRLGAVLCLLAVGCGGETDPERAVAEWVLDTGGRVGLSSDGETVTAGSAAELPAGTFHISRIGWAGYPGDRFAEVTDEELRRLEGLDRLVELDLTGTAITDAGLVHVARLTQLTHLHLTDTAVTDRAIEHLVRLKNLVELGLVQTKVTDAAIGRLRKELPRCKVYR